MGAPTTVLWAFGAVAVAWLFSLLKKTISHRRFYRNLPGPPYSMVLGHAKILGEYAAKVPHGTGLQILITQMIQDFNLPQVWYLDLWPFGPEFIVLGSPDATAFPTTTNTMSQARVVHDYYQDNIGVGFIEVSNNPLWKELHKMMAPGLTPAAIRAHHEMLIDEAMALREAFDRLAKQDQAIDLPHEVGKYPFEVIGHLFFGERLNVQRGGGAELYHDTKRLAETQGTIALEANPFSSLARKSKKEKKEVLGRMNANILGRVRHRYADLQQANGTGIKSLTASIVDRMLSSQLQEGLPLDDRLTKLILDNAKGFLIAGYGTTSDTLTFILLLLSVSPESLRKLRDEHDRIFSPDHDETVRLLRLDSSRINHLDYTAAVIHETLRFFTAGTPCRQPPPDMKSFTLNGKSYPVTNQCFMLATHAMHHDAAYFPEPKKFMPERHLTGNASEPSYPRNAYRPFERGLRACIGQNLAMDEMKIALLLMVRWFDFEMVGHEPSQEPKLGHSDLDTLLGIQAFTVQRFTNGPRDGCLVKITAREGKQ